MMYRKYQVFVLLLTAMFLTAFVCIINGVGSENKRQDLFFKEPQRSLPIDLKAEELAQKQADEGHSPWRLDLIQSTITFVSLKISPEGIIGPFPIKEKNIRIIQETKEIAIVEVIGDTPVRRVYFKRLIRKDQTGIWTVVGYDEATPK